MSKEEKNKIVPKLRFPEFEESGEWEVAPLRSFCSNIASGKDRIDISGEHDLYGSTGIIGKTNDCSYEGTYILVARVGANAGLLTRTNGKFGVTDNTLVIFLKLHENIDFIFSTLQRFGLNKLVFGSGQPLITGGQLKNIIVHFPKPAEQQKIADCLSSLDKFITAQSQKHQALKAHKKGLMQQLFPTEGETVPKLRFAEFKESGEWEVKTLGQVAEIITGSTPSTLESSNYVGDRMFVSPADISGSRYIYRTKTTLSEKGYSQTRHVKENSVLFVCIGSTIGKIAQNKYECATNQQINSLVANVGYSSDFVYSTLENNASKIASIAGIQAVPIINKSIFSSVLVSFPSPDEQQKIADCLTSLDELITTQTEEIEALKAHKKGLMQGLFPKLSEL